MSTLTSDEIAAKLDGTPTRFVPVVCSDEKRGFICTHKHLATAPDLDENLRAVGMRRGKDGAARFPAPTRSRGSATIAARTRENIAACAALGLSYWSDHARPHLLWAVDDQQVAHSVRVDRKSGRVEHVCAKWTEGIDDRVCPDAGRSRSYTVPANTAATLELLADADAPPAPEPAPRSKADREVSAMASKVLKKDDTPKPVKLTAAEKRAIKARNAANEAKRDAEMAAFMEARLAEERARVAAEDAAEAVQLLKAPVEQGPSDALAGPLADEIQGAALPSQDTPAGAFGHTPPRHAHTASGGMSLGAARALMHHDPDYLGDIPTDALRKLRALPSEHTFHNVIDAELDDRFSTDDAVSG